MPIGQVKVSWNRPCMDSETQISNNYYALELMRDSTCPVDVNSKLT